MAIVIKSQYTSLITSTCRWFAEELRLSTFQSSAYPSLINLDTASTKTTWQGVWHIACANHALNESCHTKTEERSSVQQELPHPHPTLSHWQSDHTTS